MNANIRIELKNIASMQVLISFFSVYQVGKLYYSELSMNGKIKII